MFASVASGGAVIIKQPASGGGGAIAGVEERCEDLGANCLCGEELDTTESFSALPGIVNFSDSPSSHDCSQYGGGFQSEGSSSPFSMQLAASVAPLPSGATATRVLQLTGGNNNYIFGKDEVEATDSRMCQRYYFRVSDDFTGSGYPGDGCPTERNKMFQLGFGPSKLVQLEERSNFGPGTSCGAGIFRNFWIAAHANGASSPGEFTYRYSDCDSSSGWCRIELCVAGDLSAGTGIEIDARIKPLGGTIETRNPSAEPWNAATALGGFGEGISADLFHGQGSGGDTGEMWITHYMQAAWSTDSGQWIGCSPEVEGPTNCPVAGGD